MSSINYPRGKVGRWINGERSPPEFTTIVAHRLKKYLVKKKPRCFFEDSILVKIAAIRKIVVLWSNIGRYKNDVAKNMIFSRRLVPFFSDEMHSNGFSYWTMM